MSVATFGKDLKGLVSVGNLCLVASEDISEIPQDCILCNYYPMFFWKIKKRFALWLTRSKVSILTPADDPSGLMIQSTNARTHKLNAPTLKLFNKV